MSVVSAVVEASGWVLAVRHAAAVLTIAQRSFGSETGEHPLFPLDPDGTPKIMVTQTGLGGFARQGGEAVAAVTAGPMAIGVRPLRTPYGATAPGSDQSVSYLDQVDHGDGTVTVRVALSERVLAGAAVEAVFLPGWRTGLGAATATATNGSARQAVLPIARWAVPNLQLVRGSAAAPLRLLRVESIVASHYARHHGAVRHQAVAAVRYTVSDGATVKHFWFNVPTVSDAYGDNACVWGGLLDLDGLRAGVVTVHRSVFPWIGAARHTCGTDPAGMSATALQSTVLADGFSVHADAPLHACLDPVAQRYPYAVVVVAASGGSTDTSAAGITVGSGVDRAAALATARAGTRAATLTAALQRISIFNRQLAAANGFPAAANCADWAEIIFEAGTHAGAGSTAVSSLLKCAEGRVILSGDPSNANAQSDCVLRTNATASSTPALRVSRLWAQNMTLEHMGISGSAFGPSSSAYWHYDDVVLRGVAGAESSTVPVLSSAPSPSTGLYWLSATRTRWWRYGTGMEGTNQRFGLVRACTAGRAIQALALVHCEQVADPTVTYAGGAGFGPHSFGGWASSALGVADQMAWGCVALRNNGRFYVPAKASGTGTSADPETYLRAAIVNCLSVRANNSTEFKFYQTGENQNNQTQDSLIEGCSFVGQRISFHNDPPIATDNLRHTGNVVRGCYMDRISSKSDTYPTQSANRTGSWELLYGVGWHGNVFGERSSIGDEHTLFYYGRERTRPLPPPGVGTASVALFLDDQSNWGPNAVPVGSTGVGQGGGDYRVGPGSPLLSRLSGAMSADRLRDGAARELAAGATGGMPGLGAASAVLAHRVAASRLEWLGALSVAAARAGLAAAGGRADVTVTVGAQTAVGAISSMGSELGVSVLVAGESCLLLVHAEAGLLAWAGGLDPVAASHVVLGTGVGVQAGLGLSAASGAMLCAATRGELELTDFYWTPGERVRPVAAELRVRRAMAN